MNFEILMTADILRKLHVHERRLAFRYITYAMELVDEEQNRLEHITKTIYIDIAVKYHTNTINVERGVRDTIEYIWKRKEAHAEFLEEVFGAENMDYRPTNTEFFRCMYRYISTKRNNYLSQKCPVYKCVRCSQQEECIFFGYVHEIVEARKNDSIN